MIGTGEPEILGRSVEKARQWIAETAAELGTDDHRAAYRELKAVHVPRSLVEQPVR